MSVVHRSDICTSCRPLPADCDRGPSRAMNRNNTLQHDSGANTLDGATTQAPELEQLARWMDSVFEIPILKLRFGLDALLGLLPGGGDVGAALVSVYILSAANRYGVSRITILRMAVNIALDIIVGSIPIAGDLFDAYWKSNQRNVALLRRHQRNAKCSVQ